MPTTAASCTLQGLLLVTATDGGSLCVSVCAYVFVPSGTQPGRFQPTLALRFYIEKHSRSTAAVLVQQSITAAAAQQQQRT